MADRLPQKSPDLSSGEGETSQLTGLSTATFHGDAVSEQRLGPFEILEKLGEGGMGVVYKARDTRLDRLVAIKLVRPGHWGDNEGRRRLRREARVAARLDHPNVCTVYSIEEIGDSVCIVMQFVEGSTLQSLVERGPLPLERFLPIAVQAARGLAEAHRRGIVHRDIKSSNIMVSESGQVKILDFGLSRSTFGHPESQMITAAGAILGTLAYAAPEQLRGEPADSASDVFSFGVVLYQALTGKRPFAREHAASTLSAILSEELPRVQAVRPDIPKPLADIVDKSLNKDRAKRYQNAGALLSDLEKVAAEGSISIPSEPPRAAPVRGLRIAALFVVALVGLAAGALWWRAHARQVQGPGPKLVGAAVAGGPGLPTPNSSATEDRAGPSVAVLAFTNLNKESRLANLEIGIAESLTEALVATGRFRPVERTQLDHVLEELKLNATQYVDPATAQKIGRLVGARFLVVGSFETWQGQLRMNARVLRVETGEIVCAKRVSGPLADALKLPDRLAAELLSALP